MSGIHQTSDMNENGDRPARLAGLLLGLGLGGFVDGILLHQILQWHHMLSTVLPPTSPARMRTNMLWDGLFHFLTWTLTLIGVVLLWHAARRSPVRLPTRWFIGLLFAGWGLFNVVEGLIDHHLLNIHHVRRYAPDPVWDYGYLLSGLALLLFGGALVRSGQRYASD